MQTNTSGALSGARSTSPELIAPAAVQLGSLAAPTATATELDSPHSSCMQPLQRIESD